MSYKSGPDSDVEKMKRESTRVFRSFNNKKTIKLDSQKSMHAIDGLYKTTKEEKKLSLLEKSMYIIWKPTKRIWKLLGRLLRCPVPEKEKPKKYDVRTFQNRVGFQVVIKQTADIRAAKAASVFNLFLFFSFLVFPAVSTKILHTWSCKSFSDDNDDFEHTNEGEFLKSDYSLKCGTSTHWRFKYWAITMIFVYPIGIPSMYFFLLYSSRKSLDPRQERFMATEVFVVGDEVLHYSIDGHLIMEEALSKDDNAHRLILDEQGALDESVRIQDLNALIDPKVARLKFLYEAYEPKYVGKRASRENETMTSEATIILLLSRLATHEERSDEYYCCRGASLLVCSSLLLQHFVASLLVGLLLHLTLFINNNRYYYFEVVESIRRLMLTCIVGFCKPGTASQIVFSILYCLASMRIYSSTSPFVSDRIDKLAEIAQWQLFFTMLGALCLRVDMTNAAKDELEQNAFEVALGLIQLIIPGLMLL